MQRTWSGPPGNLHLAEPEYHYFAILFYRFFMIGGGGAG
jgi:hypothetical protein